ncbi:hypothetical protein [Dyella sp.]|uniref:hypothetical protein n=1 Tax=Dyella sp. TaxID=1869338 RepID=UPI002ED69B69
MTLRRAIVLSLGSLLAVTAMAGETPASQADRQKVEVDRKVRQQHDQVQQLQQDVARQEAKSRDAAERGARQDQAIEDLRRQLKATQATGTTGH